MSYKLKLLHYFIHTFNLEYFANILFQCKIIFILIILQYYLKILLFKRKSPSANAKGLEIVRLPLLDRFRTFNWGMIIEELLNIYKLKDLIKVPKYNVSGCFSVN